MGCSRLVTVGFGSMRLEVGSARLLGSAPLSAVFHFQLSLGLELCYPVNF